MKRFLYWSLASIAVLVVCVGLAFWLSPWPGVMLIRYAFGIGDATSEARLVKHVPPDLVIQADLAYGEGPDETLDINLPPGATGPLPAIVWVHGGGWVSGSKQSVANYLKVLAGHGYATVNLGYSIAPDSLYPTPVRQVNAALDYITRNGTELGIDPQRIILGGDSAGAQIAAQVANLITAPDYAAQVGITPGLAPEQLRAVLLVSGAFDAAGLEGASVGLNWFTDTVLWAYTGQRDLDDPQFALASVTPHVTADFPPAFITSGNGDVLSPQAVALAERLTELEVPVTTLFFPDDYAPALPHEYQFNLDTPEGRQSLEQMMVFVDKHMAD
jgi:acetyl esterase